MATSVDAVQVVLSVCSTLAALVAEKTTFCVVVELFGASLPL